MSSADIEGPSGPFVQTVAAAALTGAVVMTVGMWLDSTTPAPPLPLLFAAVLVVAAVIIALAAALIGLPLTWLLARRRKERPWTYPAAGLVAGAFVMVGILGIAFKDDGHPAAEWLLMASLGAVPGLVCGLSWWFFYRRHVQAEDGE